MKPCSYCGYSNNDEALYCAKCGRRLDAFAPNGLPSPSHKADKEGKADLASVLSIVLGIVGIIFDAFAFFVEGMWGLFVVGLLCGAFGLICAVRNKLHKTRGYGLAGFILSIIATIWGGVIVLLIITGLILVLI